MNNLIHFSLVQADLIWENEQENLKKFNKLIADVSAQTEIIILPEMFSTGFTMNVQNLEKPIGKRAFNWLKNKAVELNKIIVGSILTEENGKYFNRMYWMRPDGSFAFYDKRHLFHQGGEDKVMTAGNKKTIVTYKGIRFLLLICYDLRFPVWSKNNYDTETEEFDYDAIIYIANWPEIRKQAYTYLLKARAIENQANVLWVNRVGVDIKQVYHSGNTQIIDYSGDTIVCIDKQEKIINHSIDFNMLFEYRNSFKVGLDWDVFIIKK
jgi:predicted amidohydrolase